MVNPLVRTPKTTQPSICFSARAMLAQQGCPVALVTTRYSKTSQALWARQLNSKAK
jgi:hypothetical protein